MNKESPSLVLLVDGDNISHKTIKPIIDEASKHGNLKIRRVYGDWTKQDLAAWKEAANLNALLQIQQSNYTSGKNSTDGALIIDAMDMLYTDAADGFCIVSSDSDYTRLAIKLREHGKFVLGIGNKHTPKSLVNACHLFTYIETITSEDMLSDGDAEPNQNSKRDTATIQHVGSIPRASTEPDQNSRRTDEWISLITRAVEESSGEDEWVLLTKVGNRLRETNPAFDPRVYGHKKLHLLIDSKPERFELKPNEVSGVHSGHLIRLKPMIAAPETQITDAPNTNVRGTE